MDDSYLPKGPKYIFIDHLYQFTSLQDYMPIYFQLVRVLSLEFHDINNTIFWIHLFFCFIYWIKLKWKAFAYFIPRASCELGISSSFLCYILYLTFYNLMNCIFTNFTWKVDFFCRCKQHKQVGHPLLQMTPFSFICLVFWLSLRRLITKLILPIH